MYNNGHFRCTTCQTTGDNLQLSIIDLTLATVPRKNQYTPCFILQCKLSCFCGNVDIIRIPVERIEV